MDLFRLNIKYIIYFAYIIYTTYICANFKEKYKMKTYLVTYSDTSKEEVDAANIYDAINKIAYIGQRGELICYNTENVSITKIELL